MSGAGGVISHTLDVVASNIAGGVISHTRDVGLENIAGGVITHTLDNPTSNLIRGPQFKYRDIEVDRFTNNILSVITSINAFDLTAAATTGLYTVPASNTLLLSGIIIRVTSSSNVTVDAQVEIGVNPSTDNLFAVETLVQTRDFNDLWSFWADKSTNVVIPGGETIDLTVVTGAAASSLYADIFLIGLLLF